MKIDFYRLRGHWKQYLGSTERFQTCTEALAWFRTQYPEITNAKASFAVKLERI
jgi:hypothetical protein